MAKRAALGKTALDRRRRSGALAAVTTSTAPQGQLSSPVAGVEFTARGAHFPAELDEEDWMRVGDYLAEVGQAFQWCVIDWLQYGEAKYGEKYKALAERTGLATGTLMNWLSAGKGFEPSRRRENLSFSHYVEVKKLEPAKADRLLQKAEAEGWTVRQTREAAQRIEGRDRPKPKTESNLPVYNDLKRMEKNLPASLGKLDAKQRADIKGRLRALWGQIEV